MLRIEEQALTFDDVLLVPKYSSVLPQETDLSTKLTKQVNLKIPIVSAAMDTVTESRMSIALAELGGIGIIHKNISITDQAKELPYNESTVALAALLIFPLYLIIRWVLTGRFTIRPA